MGDVHWAVGDCGDVPRLSVAQDRDSSGWSFDLDLAEESGEVRRKLVLDNSRRISDGLVTSR